MVEAKDEANVRALATRIAASISGPCEIDDLRLTVKASVGIALYPEHGSSVHELLKAADEAMYIAKELKQGPTFFRKSDGAR